MLYYSRLVNDMKLNNKAFAASTILYGILTITLLLMMLILATMKSTNRLNSELVDRVEYQLNNCIDDEIALDKCRLEEDDCDMLQEAYSACLGDNSFSNR